MSASALAGCNELGLFGANPQGCWDNGSKDSPNWILAFGTDANWYVFQYVPIVPTFNAFVLKNASYAPPAASKHLFFDVMTWYTANPSNFSPVPGTTAVPGTIMITVNARTVTIKVISGQTDSTSTTKLQSYQSKFIPCSWNEIGT